MRCLWERYVEFCDEIYTTSSLQIPRKVLSRTNFFPCLISDLRDPRFSFRILINGTDTRLSEVEPGEKIGCLFTDVKLIMALDTELSAAKWYRACLASKHRRETNGPPPTGSLCFPIYGSRMNETRMAEHTYGY